MIFFEKLEQHVLCIFVRYVSDHYSGSAIGFNLLNVNHVGFWLFVADSSAVANRRGLSHIIIIFFGGNHMHHQRHHWNWHRVNCSSGIIHRIKASRIGLWAGFSFLCNNLHAGVNNLSNHLIFLFTFWGVFLFFPLLLLVFRLIKLFSFILK